MTQFTRKVSKRAGRIISLARGHGRNNGAHHLNISQTNHLAAQLSEEAQGNMSNPPNMPFFSPRDIVGDTSAPAAFHRSAYSMSRFLGPCSEAPWTPEARREAHDESRLTELSILSSNLLTIIGLPVQGPPHIADNSNDPLEPYAPGTVWPSKFQSDPLARFLDPKSESPWTSEDLGRRERVVENLWLTTQLLCSDYTSLPNSNVLHILQQPRRSWD
ncbi:hypothetical protein L211DRAFT_576105 [Terfezia boudieri ATCC MYA-4762]|uniref:Uncharacterized protein n=1 Tax=Terfezia boudieri ATCC MYA-4762 TaxID=1051890 RepID=A0A3N4LEY8_9PEZI|nr:hypothetical protein L211DRAFT_576105 [Terfezia boudieri ATCC MYA-4762]